MILRRSRKRREERNKLLIALNRSNQSHDGRVWASSDLPLLHTLKLQRQIKTSSFHQQSVENEVQKIFRRNTKRCVSEPQNGTRFKAIIYLTRRFSTMNCETPEETPKTHQVKRDLLPA